MCGYNLGKAGKQGKEVSPLIQSCYFHAPFIFSWPTNDLKRLGSSFFETFMMAGCKGGDNIGCGGGEDQN